MSNALSSSQVFTWICHLVRWNRKFLYVCVLRCRLTGALATASGDDAVRVFKEDESADPDQLLFSLAAQVTKAHSQDVNCVAWNPKEAGLLASCSDNGEMAIWRFQEEDWMCGVSLNKKKLLQFTLATLWSWRHHVILHSYLSVYLIALRDSA